MVQHSLIHYLLLTAIAVVVGTLCEFQFVVAILVSLLVLAGVMRAFNIKCAVLLLLWGICFLYGHLWLQSSLSHRLPLTQDKHQAELFLQVVAVEMQPQIQKLTVRVLSESNLKEQQLPELRYLRLNYYQTQPQLFPQQKINAQVLLRSPHNLSNGLAFDYEAWLLMQQVDATGYIKSLNVLSFNPELSFRSQIIEYCRQQIPTEQWPWVAGLVFGEQDAFSDEQWQLAKVTGTLHLLVVSGLHMGIMVLLCLVVWGVCIRLINLILRRGIRQHVLWRSVFLVSISLGYLWLAGAGIALQRAWIMLLVAVLLYSSRLQLNWLVAISTALLIVLIVNPLIWLSAGFAYSFMAVLALLLFFQHRKSNKLEALWLPQVIVFLALFPIFVYWQQPVSLMQCLANLLAIPWLSLVLMPLTLLVMFMPDIGQQHLLILAGDLFWWWLNYLSNIPLSKVVFLPKITWLIWPLWVLVLLRGQNYFIARLVVLVVMAVVFTQQSEHRVQASMLDVGQGQALIFTTSKQSLVYDTGPFMGNFDSGEAIVRPALQQLGVRRLDALIVSHQDNDHSGGTQTLLEVFDAVQYLGGEPLADIKRPIQFCEESSSAWQVLDEFLLYRYLKIPEKAWEYLPSSHNNRSCIIQLSWYGITFLLTGDIAKPIEYELIRNYGSELKSDILVLAHHGSRYSSSEVFLRQVAPNQAWISSGFNNRFNHPSEEVLQRLEKLGIPWLNTAESGRIWLDILGNTHTQREKWQPPWRNR